MLHLLVAATLASPSAIVAWRPMPGLQASRFPAFVSSSEAACDDGTSGGTLVERQDSWYGNLFAAPCAAGHILAVRLTHFGYGLPGPYEFRLHLLDLACRELGVTPVLAIPGAPDLPATTSIDLSDFGWCIEGGFHLLLEPLTCADGGTGHDCFPALVVDASSDGDGPAHCAVVSAAAADGRQCFAARSADGRFFDFGLRVEVGCAAPECATAVQAVTWGRVKRIYTR
jgi:hypothetical protein